jgi:hypothetical protein
VRAGARRSRRAIRRRRAATSAPPRRAAAAPPTPPADDCNGEGLFNNYCIHILGRKPTMSAQLTDKLVKAALAMNLNTQSLPFNYTHQDGCW